MFTGLRRDVAWRDLATVQAEYAASGRPARCEGAWAAPLDGDSVGLSFGMTFALPFSQTDNYNADVRWERTFDESAGEALYSVTVDSP